MNIQAIAVRRGKERKARGFSRSELKEIDLTFKDALGLGVPIDIRRRTKTEENIETLKKNIKRKPAKPKKRSVSSKARKSPKNASAK